MLSTQENDKNCPVNNRTNNNNKNEGMMDMPVSEINSLTISERTVEITEKSEPIFSEIGATLAITFLTLIYLELHMLL